MRRSALLAIVTMGLALAGCGASTSVSTSGSTTSTAGTGTQSTSTSSSGATVHVTMQNLAFHPATIHAKVGDTVIWTNQDGPTHNVTYQGGPKFASSPNLSTGQSFRLKLTQPGTIQYFCSIHPFMKASIVVAP